MRAIAEFTTFDKDFIPQLKKHLVGKKIRSITKHRITLTDGTELWLCDDQDCCSYDELTASEINLDSDMVITNVALTKLEIDYGLGDLYVEGEEPRRVTIAILGTAEWGGFLTTQLGEIVQKWDPGNPGYYCAVGHVEVYAPNAEGEQEPDVYWDAFTPQEEAGE